MKRVFAFILCLVLLAAALPAAPARAAGSVWDGTVDISWYDPDETEFYLSTPAELAGLAALVNGMKDPTCPRFIGDESLLQSVRVDDYQLVGAGGGNVSDTVYSSTVDFAYKTVYLTADMDMGGVYDAASGAWSGPNWTPIGGKFPMLPQEVDGDCLTLDTRFNGVLDGQGHTITNLYCDRYAAKGFPYSMAIGIVGFLGGVPDTDPGSDAKAVFETPWQPAVRNLVLGSGSILGRRMVGGVVGRIGQTSHGVLVENCANFARVKSTDAKGVGGIVGSGWGSGMIRNCYNAGYITTTYSSPAGGIVGTNSGMDVYNCYSIGTIDTNGQQRGRPIGSHDSGVYTVENCYYLEGSGDDPTNPGYYKGISKKITVSVTGMTAEQMKSGELLAGLNANGAAFAADVNGINGGYPVLWFQNGVTGGDCRITVSQPSGGGSIAIEGEDTVPFGTTVTLSCRPDTGYTLDHYVVNGEAIASNFFIATEDTTVSAVFRLLVTVPITIPESDDYYVAVAREGWRIEGDEMVWADQEMLRSGDTLVQGNVLTVLIYGYGNAVPSDMDLEYIDAYSCELSGTSKNANGTYIVTGECPVEVSVSRTAAAKSWLNYADTEWYVSGGRRTSYTLKTPEELAGLACLVNRDGVTFEGVTIRLGNDICLQNTDGTVGVRLWTPIGSNLNRSFRGVFDGQNYAVYDMTVRSASSGAGLFGYCVGAVVKNVSVYGSVSSSASAAYAAGVAAYVSGGSVENCLNYAPVGATGTHAGGITAMLRDGGRIENCMNCAPVTAASGLGGIAGISDTGADVISYCANFSPVTSTGNSTYGIGGIVGRLAGSVTGCVNYADVGGTDRYTGGIAGYMPGKNTSTVTLSSNSGSVSSGNSMATAALGGVVGYAQFAKLAAVENAGSVMPESSFTSGHSGAVIGREGTVTVTEKTENDVIPVYTEQAPRVFPGGEKDEYTVTFMAGDETVSIVTYRPGDTAVPEPAVPQMEGYNGAWSPYALGDRDIIVHAVYRQRTVRGGDTITENGSWHIAWFSTGVITLAPGVSATLDGSNAGTAGFDGLTIRAGEGASLTLRDTVLRGENTMLDFAGGNTLAVEGSNRLLSRAEAQNNAAATIRTGGDLTIAGSGTLYVTAGIRNTAVSLDRTGSTLTLRGGTLTVYKEDLLGFEGGAVYAPGSTVRITGGTLKGRTSSDNVSVVSAGRVELTGGAVYVQAERSPLAIAAPVTASGGTIAAYGHTGNSASFVKAYHDAEALESYTGTAKFTSFLTFNDVFVTDDWYDAVGYCYDNGYFNGTSDTTFSPEASMNRAMFVTVLYRMAGRPAVSGVTAFTDLTQDWYRDAVIWAVGRGIVNGTSETTFSPNAPVTREQAAVFLYRYARSANETFERVSGADLSRGTVSPWAQTEVLWALSSGLFIGVDGVMSDPQSYAPRGLLAIAVNNYMKTRLPDSSQSELPFTDVYPSDSFYDAVKLCYSRGYFNGTSDTTFSPYATMNRAMFVTALHRLAGKPAAETVPAFTDLNADWYRDSVAWAAENEIVNGYSSEQFAPGDPISVEQAAAVLYRYARYAGQTLPQTYPRPANTGAVSGWAKESMDWALRGGLFNGTGDAVLSPTSPADRALLSMLIANYDALAT